MMTTATMTDPRATTTGGDRLRQVVVIASAVAAVVGSFVGSGAAGGTPIQDASGGALSADATLISPDEPAFVIWTPIYAGLLAYAIWQALPRQAAAPRQRRLGYWVAASLVLNAAWILSVQYDMLALSAVVIVALLAVLATAFVLLVDSRPSGLAETVVLDGTMGLYFGWVTIATVANITSLLVATGVTGAGIPPEGWAIGLIVVASLIGVGVAMRGRGRLSPAIALAWGLFWVGVSRIAGSLPSTATAIAAFIGCAVVLLAAVLFRIRAARAARP